MASIAQIYSILAPAQAAPGDTVQFSITLKNISSSTHILGATMNIDYSGHHEEMDLGWNAVPAGWYQSFDGSFVMPSEDVQLIGWSRWYDEFAERWVFEDYLSKNIALTELETVFSVLKVTSYGRQ